MQLPLVNMSSVESVFAPQDLCGEGSSVRPIDASKGSVEMTLPAVTCPMCFIFTPIWGRFPFWLIFFNGLETTNKFFFEIYFHNILEQLQVDICNISGGTFDNF